ncbi:hypothetical protein [Paenibacillus sp. R14(2021)]|uniref:hypothetical protein n=1 Tax=Paenibacillus sp. R14(2021) TaxID=2859228 RepID=UPI001C613711|nr:hypothetical protein [Paenibacillus sp. R14(2021)]
MAIDEACGASWNGEPLEVGGKDMLCDAHIATGFQAKDWKPGSFFVEQLGSLAGAARNVRIYRLRELGFMQGRLRALDGLLA